MVLQVQRRRFPGTLDRGGIRSTQSLVRRGSVVYPPLAGSTLTASAFSQWAEFGGDDSFSFRMALQDFCATAEFIHVQKPRFRNRGVVIGGKAADQFGG